MKIRGVPETESTEKTTPGGKSPNGRKADFSREMESEAPPQYTANIYTALRQIIPAEGLSQTSAEERLVRLGTITKESPTVSHLLIRSPDYQKRCWELIYAAQNRTKPYREIPIGKTIYLDPEKEEILWDDGSMLQTPALLDAADRSSFTVSANRAVATYDSIQSDKLPQPGAGTDPKLYEASPHSAASLESSATDEHLGSVLVKKLRRFIGTSYKHLNCYELVVEGLRNLGIQYGGKDGLQQQLISRAKAKQLPANAYLTGDGLIEASANSIYLKSFPVNSQPRQKTEEIWNEIQPLLEPGLMVAFSAGRRGHTGIVARHEDEWTLINSGYMDNDVHSPAKRRRVGEERLKEEIYNWLRRAYDRQKPLSINLGRLNGSKIAAYQEGNAPDNLSTNL